MVGPKFGIAATFEGPVCGPKTNPFLIPLLKVFGPPGVVFGRRFRRQVGIRFSVFVLYGVS